MSLPIEKLDKLVLKEKLARLGVFKTKENVMKKLQVFDPLYVAAQVCAAQRSIRR